MVLTAAVPHMKLLMLENHSRLGNEWSMPRVQLYALSLVLEF